MARYHGARGVVYLATSGTGTAGPVASVSGWTLDRATDKVDVTAFGDANKTYVTGLPDIKGTLTAWFDDTDDKFFDAADSLNGAFLYLYPSSAAPTIFHAGPAWLDASIECTNTGAVTIKGSFVANGSWTRQP